MAPALPASEFPARLERLERAFAPLDVTAVLVLGARNWYRDHAIRYIADYDNPRGASAILWRIGEAPPILLTDAADDLARARRVSRVADVSAAPDLAAAVGEWVSTLPSSRLRLGLAGGECMGYTALEVLPRNIKAAIRAAAPQAELVDAGGALNGVRMIRSAAEIEMARGAAAIADIGAEAFLATARAGITEREVFAAIWHAMQRAGSDDVHISMCRGPGSFWPHPPSDAQLAPGDILSIELSPRIGGYFSQANRMCFIGAPSRETRALAALARGALDLALSMVKPGVEARSVVTAVSAYVARSPLATMDVGGVHRIGHGCGQALDEGPFLTSASTSVLQPNMTMALHPIIYLPYRHALLMLGDYVQVTNTGAVVLTRPQIEIPAL